MQTINAKVDVLSATMSKSIPKVEHLLYNLAKCPSKQSKS